MVGNYKHADLIGFWFLILGGQLLILMTKKQEKARE